MSSVLKAINNMNIGWFVIIVVFLILVFSAFYNKKISFKFYICLLFVVFAALLYLDWHLRPPETFDLYRYFDELNYYRQLNFLESISMICSRANFLWYLILRICALFKQNVIIMILTTTIFFVTHVYILFKAQENYYISNTQIALSVLSCFSIVNFIHTMSGLRNVLAVSIFALGFFKILFENNKKGYIFLILSLFIHPMTIIFIVLFSAYRILSKIKYSEIFVFLWKYLSKLILLVISIIPISLFQLYKEKLRLELDGNFGVDYLILTLEIIQMLYYIYILYKMYGNFVVAKKNSDNKLYLFERKTIMYFYFLVIFILGSIGMINIFIRCRFLVAFFIPFIMALKNKYLGINDNLEKPLLFLTLLINFYYIYYMMCNANFIF